MAAHTPPGSNWGEGGGGEAQHACTSLDLSPKVLNAAFVIAPEDWLRPKQALFRVHAWHKERSDHEA
jgi:hypothetical protein